MIVDMRYHVASLVAVFLALGLGIVVGANLGVSTNPQFEKQIEQLEQTYQKIRTDQKSLEASLQLKNNELEIANQFQNAIVPSLVGNRLLGKRIAIIRTNDSIDFKYAKQVVNLLRRAGAEVTSITSITKPFDFSDPQFQTELVQAFNLNTGSAKDLFPLVCSKMMQIIVQGQGSLELLFLQNKDLIQLWGDYNRGYVDTLIFLGGGMNPESDHQKELDLPLLESVRKTGVTVVGVEPSFVTNSYMRLYQSKSLGTVDNIDTAPGEVSLVYLLANGKRGYYGVKDTARSLLPALKLNY